MRCRRTEFVEYDHGVGIQPLARRHYDAVGMLIDTEKYLWSGVTLLAVSIAGARNIDRGCSS